MLKVSRRKYNGIRMLAGASLLAFLSHPANAQVQNGERDSIRSDSNQFETIVVTAQRRETDLQTTSASVSALSRDMIESARVRSVEDVALLVPNVTFAQSNNEQQVSIRGVGVDNAFFTAEAGVAIYLDGVFLGRPNIATAALSDLERIEIVRGPQGTLYGRNATGGAINIITRGAEDDFGGRFFGSFGNYDALEIGGAITGPLGQDVSGRVSAVYSRRDGYVRNLADGSRLDGMRDFSSRAVLHWDATDRLSFDLRGDYQRIRSTGPANQPYNVDSNVGPDVVQFTFGPGTGRYTNAPRTVFHDLNADWTRTYYGSNLTATYDFDDVSLKSITAYRHSSTNQDADLDGTDGILDTLHNVRTPTSGLSAHQFSQELQLASDGTGMFNYIFGLYYYDEHARVGIVIDQSDFMGGVFRTDSTVVQDTRTEAAYGELYFNPSENLRFTAGLRYTSDHKSFTSSIGAASSGANTDNSWTPKIGVEYAFSDDVFGYLTVSRGFKAGGFNPYTNSGFYEPETLWSYETGLRTRLFDGRVQANLSAFTYDYNDIQVTQYTFLGPDISNVGTASINGIELELQVAPTRGLVLGGSASYIDAEYGNFSITDLLTGMPTNVGGNQVPKSSEWSLAGNVQYNFDIGSVGELELRYDIAYKSSFYFSSFNTLGTRQKGYTLSNAQITYRPAESRLSISAFVRNITDEAVFTQATQASSLLLPTVTYNPPRNYGVSAAIEF